MTVRWGVVGAGYMAGRVAPGIAASGRAELVAVASRDPERARDLGARFGARSSYGSYAELLADKAVEAVYVATPNAFHAEHTLAALEAGKHVLVEKPMALTVEAAEGMVETAARCDVRLGVGFHLRHHPVHLELARLLGSGVAGAPIYAHAVWGAWAVDFPHGHWGMDPKLAGGGSMMGRGVHVVDLFCWLLGRPLQAAALADGPSERYEIEWLTVASLRFEDDVLAQLASSRRLPNPDNSFVIYGSEARLEARSTLSMEPEGELRVTRGGETEIRRIPLADLYALEIEAFSRAVEEGTEFHASGEDGLTSVQVTTAIVESARSGRAEPIAGGRTHAGL